MTVKPPTPCKVPGCKDFAFKKSLCEKHYAEKMQKEIIALSSKNYIRHDERKSPSARGYDARWRKARRSFLAKHPICRACRSEPATEVDHIKDHKGDPALFWNVLNWQPLCHSCHSKKTFRENNFFSGKKKKIDIFRMP